MTDLEVKWGNGTKLRIDKLGVLNYFKLPMIGSCFAELSFLIILFSPIFYNIHSRSSTLL